MSLAYVLDWGSIIRDALFHARLMTTSIFASVVSSSITLCSTFGYHLDFLISTLFASIISLQSSVYTSASTTVNVTATTSVCGYNLQSHLY